jgi:hypothetical protein
MPFVMVSINVGIFSQIFILGCLLGFMASSKVSSFILLLREMRNFTGGSRKSCRIGSCDDS